MSTYQEEYLRRKAKRVAHQAQNATFLKEFTHNGSGRLLKVYRAERSRGYQTNYERVPIFYLLIYQNGELIHGQTMTKREWQKWEPEFAQAVK